MTVKLFQTDMYMKEADSTVVSLEGNRLVLEGTVFAPAAGGQPCDRGTVNGIPVVDVQEENGVIVHTLDPSAAEDSEAADAALSKMSAGAVVHMVIDWNRRFDHMQNHLGEHILSGLFKKVYDLDNKGFHLGEEHATFDIDSKEITQEMLDKIEDLANQVIYDALPVTVEVLENFEAASALPLRKELKVEEDITVVTVPGVDCVACCCPHPANTSQIGVIKLIRTEKYKGMTRIHFKCGRRALMDYRQKHNVTTVLNEKYSADEFSLLDKIKIADDKNESIRKNLNRMKNTFAEIHAEKMLAEADRVVVGEMENAKIDDLKRIAKKLVEMTDLPVAISSASDLCVFLTHSGKSKLKCGKIVKEFATGAGGKGGGGDTQAQVIFNNLDLMRNFIMIVKASV
ncbi:MAG: alanyl-tRNA editing protein [Firmicutes bacterium]|nr:alanyl-tRNA editing protein [Bacillota bacterium]